MSGTTVYISSSLALFFRYSSIPELKRRLRHACKLAFMGHQINIVSTDRANVVASAAIGAREGTTPQSTRLTAGRESWDRRALDPSRHLAFTSNEQVTYMASETDSPDILLRCALDLFGRHGFDGTSTRAIAAARSEEHTSELQSPMR